MRAIPVSARERILQLYEQGKSTREIADFFGFCVAAVRRVRQQFQERGTLQPQTHLCGRKTLLNAGRQARRKSWWRPSPTRRWPSWGRVWTALSGPPPWICGCANWG